MDISDIIRVVSADGAQQLQTALATFALWGIGIIVGVALAVWALREFRTAFRRQPIARRVVLVAMMAAATIFAQKTGTVSFPFTDVEKRYFFDAGSYVTNDYVHVAFRAIGIPEDADFNGYYRAVGSTNDADWTQFLLGTVGEYVTPTNVPFAGAISNDFQFFSTYVVGPTVHTNGVLNVKWGKPYNLSGTLCEALPVQTEVRLDETPIATPGSIYTNDVIYLNANLINALMEEYDE